MSTGQPHAKAERSILRSFKRSDLMGAINAGSWFSVRIQVAGDFVALLVKESVDTVGGFLEIWNYTRSSELSVRNFIMPPFLLLITMLPISVQHSPRNWHRRFQLCFLGYVHNCYAIRFYRTVAFRRPFHRRIYTVSQSQIRAAYVGLRIHILVHGHERESNDRLCPAQ
jgi:hypothetical protein